MEWGNLKSGQFAIFYFVSDACHNKFCGAGKVCQLSATGEPECICIPSCPIEVDPRRKVLSTSVVVVLKMIKKFLHISLCLQKQCNIYYRSAQTTMKHGDQTVKFIRCDACVIKVQKIARVRSISMFTLNTMVCAER